MEMFGVAVNVRSFVNTSMKQWNTELTASNQRLGNVKIRRGIFQGDSLSPLLLVLVMIPLTLMLGQTKTSYELKKGGKKINRVWVTKTWGVNHEKRKIVQSKGISMPDRKMMKNIEEGGYKYLGILDGDGVKHEEVKDLFERIH